MYKLNVPVSEKESAFIREQLPCTAADESGLIVLNFDTPQLLFRAQVLVDALRRPHTPAALRAPQSQE